MQPSDPNPKASAYSVLRSESPERWAQLELDLQASLRPEGALEHLLVHNAASGYWRVLRCKLVETALLNYETTQLATHPDTSADPLTLAALQSGLAAAASLEQSGILPFLVQAESRYQRNADRNIRLLLTLQKHRAK